MTIRTIRTTTNTDMTTNKNIVTNKIVYKYTEMKTYIYLAIMIVILMGFLTLKHVMISPPDIGTVSLTEHTGEYSC
jgi:hypothetical protein